MSKQEAMKKFISLYLRQRFTSEVCSEDECDSEAEFIWQYLHTQGLVILTPDADPPQCYEKLI